jgi:TonB family protein
LLRRDPRSRDVARPADPTRRALAALDETLASAATGERSRGSGGEGKVDPLLAWLGGGSGKHGGHGLALPALAPRLKDSRMTPATVGDVTPRGPGREEIRKVVAANAAAIRICYERALITSSQLGEGQLVVQWEINANGRVIRAAVTRDSIGDAGLQSCVLAHVRNWSFPPCQRGCRIVYPFEFYTRS